MDFSLSDSSKYVIQPSCFISLFCFQELFQGRSQGFDVEKALQAKSLRDFEEAISRVSYGFNTLEEFHISSSTRDAVGNVKIPLLFIQWLIAEDKGVNGAVTQTNVVGSELNKEDTSSAEDSNKSSSEEKDRAKVEKDNQQKDAQSSSEEKSIPTPKTEENSSPSSSSPPENQLLAKEDGANQKKEESSAQPVPVPSNSNLSPSLGLSQALDALTGMDDSTQLAVNSVFSVTEDVIT